MPTGSHRKTEDEGGNKKPTATTKKPSTKKKEVLEECSNQSLYAYLTFSLKLLPLSYEGAAYPFFLLVQIRTLLTLAGVGVMSPETTIGEGAFTNIVPEAKA